MQPQIAGIASMENFNSVETNHAIQDAQSTLGTRSTSKTFTGPLWMEQMQDNG